MTLFRYEAVAASGKLVSGEMEAIDRAAIVAYLHRLGHVPLRAEQASKTRLSRLLTTDLLVPRLRSSRHLVRLTEQLATLLQAGLPLDRALDIARGILTNPTDKDCIQAILDKVRGGGSLAEAMAAQGPFFPKFYIGMVRAGESGASLELTLRQLADYLAKSRATADDVKSALIYPSMVLITGLGAVGIMLGVVVPQLRPLFDQAGTNLPFAATTILAVSDFVQSFWWAVVIGVTLVTIGLKRVFRRPRMRFWWHGKLLTVAVLGDIVVKIELARFARTFGTLLRNGMAPLAALAMSETAMTNLVLIEAFGSLSLSLKEGKGLAGPLSYISYVPNLAVQLVRAGEEAARLDDMLLKIADIFDDEGKRSIGRLMTLLVPGITILLGIIVAAVIGALLTAILSIYDLAA